MNEHPIEGLMNTAMNNLRDMIDVNTIIGEAIETSNGTVIIPVSKVCFGFAAGGSEFNSSTLEETKRKGTEEETKSTPSVEGTGDLIVRNVEDKSVGVRDLATTHGYDVKWDNETKSVTLTKAENTIIVTVGKAEVMKNGEACTLQAAATIENQKVYVSSELEELL